MTAYHHTHLNAFVYTNIDLFCSLLSLFNAYSPKSSLKQNTY